MKKIIIGVIAVAMLAIPTAAIASVTVVDGTGFVGKGDVQTALKWNNHDFDKYAADLTFSTGTVTKVYNNSWITTDGKSYNQPRIQVLAQTLKPIPVLSSNGKQITGWDLTDVGSTKVISDTGIPAVPTNIDILASYFSPAGLAVNTLASTTVTPSVLQVTGNGVTAELPNTPVNVPTV